MNFRTKVISPLESRIQSFGRASSYESRQAFSAHQTGQKTGAVGKGLGQHTHAVEEAWGWTGGFLNSEQRLFGPRAFLADGVGPFERRKARCWPWRKPKSFPPIEMGWSYLVGPAAMPPPYTMEVGRKGAFSFLDGFQFAAQFGQTADPFAVPFVHLGQLFGLLFQWEVPW